MQTRCGRRFCFARDFAMIKTLLFVLLACHVTRTSAVGFDGIPGDYCRTRRPEQCCRSRDDDCTAPILGNHLCYCDIFCRDHPGNDCCPDFAAVCEGLTPTQRPPDLSDECVDNARRKHGPGAQFQWNCHNCTCTSDGRRNCDDTPCMIQEDLLDIVNKGRYTWQGTNFSDFWGQTLDNGIKFRLGTLYPERSVKDMNDILIEPDPNLPDRFDAREKWRNYIHPVRDQGNCGSSWAFSTTSVSADRLAIQSNGKFDAVLSPQQLLSCNQHRQKGCEGGYLDRAWYYIRKLGVVSEACYPYESGRTNQPGLCKIPQTQYRRGETINCPGSGDPKIFKMTPPYRISTKEEDIQTELFVNGPVQATFLVHEDFYMYKSGVYQHLDLARSKGPQYRKSGYHSVRILGWGVENIDGRPVKYWLCDNSWGTRWGEEGLFKIVRGENHCEIESFVLGAWGKGSKKRRRRFRLRKVKRVRKKLLAA